MTTAPTHSHPFVCPSAGPRVPMTRSREHRHVKTLCFLLPSTASLYCPWALILFLPNKTSPPRDHPSRSRMQFKKWSCLADIVIRPLKGIYTLSPPTTSIQFLLTHSQPQRRKTNKQTNSAMGLQRRLLGPVFHEPLKTHAKRTELFLKKNSGNRSYLTFQQNNVKPSHLLT